MLVGRYEFFLTLLFICIFLFLAHKLIYTIFSIKSNNFFGSIICEISLLFLNFLSRPRNYISFFGIKFLGPEFLLFLIFFLCSSKSFFISFYFSGSDLRNISISEKLLNKLLHFFILQKLLHFFKILYYFSSL